MIYVLYDGASLRNSEESSPGMARWQWEQWGQGSVGQGHEWDESSGLAWEWITPRTKGYVVKYSYNRGLVTGWIRLLQDASIWVHFHSANFKMSCKDELHALAEDEDLGKIIVSFYIDQYKHTEPGVVQPTAMSIMPDPELAWGTGDPSTLGTKQAVYSNKWWTVAERKWRNLEEKQHKKRKRETEPKPPGHPPPGAQWKW